MIIRPCTSEHLDGWVRLRQCLWPDETLDDHRSYARSLLKRPSAASYLACESDETVVAFAEALAPRLCDWLQHLARMNSSRDFMSSHDIENVDWLALFAVPLKTAPKAWAAPSLRLTFYCKTTWARECTRP